MINLDKNVWGNGDASSLSTERLIVLLRSKNGQPQIEGVCDTLRYN